MTAWRIIMAVGVLLHFAAALIVTPLAVASFAVIETAVLSWVFIFLYAGVKGWWRSSAGVLVMSLAALLATVTTVSLLPDGFGFGVGVRDWTVAALLTGMAAVTANLVKVLITAQQNH